MDFRDYERWGKKAVDWTVSYYETLRGRKVRAPLEPGAISSQIPDAPPEAPEAVETIFADFERLIPDGMTHWQHPRFLAYFPANASAASVLAEQLANALAANCMIWQTSPAGSELEARMTDWLRQALGLPPGFTGLIQDSASTATLCAILTMRERALNWEGLKAGLAGQGRLRIYASAQNHSSVLKACRIAGIGEDNLVSIGADETLAMRPDLLRDAIRADRAGGFIPAGVVLCAGGTSVGAFDRPEEILAVAQAERLYSHIDAAWSGSAMICPEFRHLWAGAEGADSIVFNPHKWLGAHFDCSVQFLKDASAQHRTLGLRPAYLETEGAEDVLNYSELTLPLGRRFRALKLWFLLRAYGLEGLRERIRDHVAWVAEAEAAIAAMPELEIVTERRLALFTFAAKAGDSKTRALLEAINNEGETYLTQTIHEGRFAIRLTAGQFDMRREDMQTALEAIAKQARLIC